MRHLFAAILGILCLWPSCPLAAQDRSPFPILYPPVYLIVDPKDAQTPLTEDFEDFFAFADSFGKKRGEIGFNIRADVDDDGDVDYNDFFAFADAFGRTAIPVQTNLVAISGVVMDPDGNPVKGAIVTLSDTLMEAGMPTKPAGNFAFPVLPGVYRLRVDLPPGSDLVTGEIALEIPKGGVDFVLGELTVKFRSDVIRMPVGKSGAPIREVVVTDSSVADLNRRMGVMRIQGLGPPGVFVFSVPANTSIGDLVEQYQSLPGVEYAEPNRTGGRYPLGSSVRVTIVLERGSGIDLYLTSEGRRDRTLFDIQPGATVSVEVGVLSGAVGATGFTARVVFDPRELTFVGLNAGDLIPGLQIASSLSDGAVEIGGAVLGGGPGAASDIGTLATLQFRVNPPLSGTAPLTLVSASLKKGSRQERFTVNQRVSIETAPGIPVPVTRLNAAPYSLTNYSGMDDPWRLVVRDAAAWQELWQGIWRNIRPAPPLPEVDFGHEMLVIAALGSRPSGGYGIVLEGGYHRTDHVEVRIRSISPGRHCVRTQLITSPVDVARMPRSIQPVRFREEQVVQECN